MGGGRMAYVAFEDLTEKPLYLAFSELQLPLMLDHIRKRALDEGLKNVVTVQASGTRPNLPKPAQSQAMTRAPSWGRASTSERICGPKVRCLSCGPVRVGIPCTGHCQRPKTHEKIWSELAP